MVQKYDLFRLQSLIQLLVLVSIGVNGGQVLHSHSLASSTLKEGKKDVETARGRPIVIGHRGSCGMFPEHTVESYRQAIMQGVDFIECDVVMTKDGEPICRHEPNIIETTDVLSHPEFASRRRNLTIDGEEMDGFFTVDFTLEEIKHLRAVQRLNFRDLSYDGLFEIPTLKEYFAVARSSEWNRSVGVYPETKRPTWHESLGLKIEDKLLEALTIAGFSDKSSVFLQSFEASSLRYLRNVSQWNLVQLLNDDWDEPNTPFPIINDGKKHTTEELLDEIALWADAIGPSKVSIVPVNVTTNKILPATKLVEEAHARGLAVHAYTFRNEYIFLAFDYGQDPYMEYSQLIYDLHLDGFFTDFPATALRFLRTRQCGENVYLHPGESKSDALNTGNCGIMRDGLLLAVVIFLMTVSFGGIWATTYVVKVVLKTPPKGKWQELEKAEQSEEPFYPNSK